MTKPRKTSSCAFIGIRELYKKTTHEAAHNAEARYPPPKCDSNLRGEEIEAILSSAHDQNRSRQVLWVKGAAGVGKTAVAQACAEMLEKQGRRFAAFFFSRKDGRMKHRQFFLTVAYQLAAEYPEYRVVLDTKICRDKSILEHKTMATQLKSLITDPLEELRRAGKGTKERIPVFVDAMEDCDDSIAKAIIDTIADAVMADKARILCWIFFSRPGRRIEAVFSCPNLSPFCHHHVLTTWRAPTDEVSTLSAPPRVWTDQASVSEQSNDRVTRFC
ncbi:hypothetical protein AN958_01700 [Leucoagaricus sp. SymC.cos]|nr:hypothetical protein AN958_01700 [Leucoagaricus sp. SymC.cos]